jgi:8-oxo-dGTP diphosphatase
MDRHAIKVACAIIEDNGLIMAAQRNKNMSMPLKWEFPGGKVESGEDPEDTIVREIKEELDLDIRVKLSLDSHLHDYGEKLIELIPFICVITGGKPKCMEHKRILWDSPENLNDLDWAGADIPIYFDYMEYINKEKP